MKINFEEIEEKALANFKGGEKQLNAKMLVDENNKILKARLQPGATVGYHSHDTGSEIIYILSGRAIATYDGAKEELTAGQVHYCPMGHSHGLENASATEDLVFFAVVPEHK